MAVAVRNFRIPSLFYLFGPLHGPAFRQRHEILCYRSFGTQSLYRGVWELVALVLKPEIVKALKFLGWETSTDLRLMA